MADQGYARRLGQVACPDCERTLFLERGAKPGDVILCPACREPLEITRGQGRLELHRWLELAGRVR